jgi:hypothetical protein
LDTVQNQTLSVQYKREEVEKNPTTELGVKDLAVNIQRSGRNDKQQRWH